MKRYLLFAFIGLLVATHAYGGQFTSQSPTTSTPVNLQDSSGNTAGLHEMPSGGYAVDVHVAHVHDDLFLHYFHNHTGASTTLDGAVSKGDTQVVVTSATGISVGDILELESGTTHIHLYRTVTVAAGTTITLDAPVPQDLASGSNVIEVAFNMVVAGTLSSPVAYTVLPAAGEVIHIERILIELVHNGAADDSKFGDKAALANGVHLRVNRNSGESYEDLTNWKLNKDIKEDMFDVDYTDKAGSGKYATSGRWTISTSGAIIRLDGDNGDTFEVLIQDAMAGGGTLVDFQMKAQGHFE